MVHPGAFSTARLTAHCARGGLPLAEAGPGAPRHTEALADDRG
jgi:hypothetical protein